MEFSGCYSYTTMGEKSYECFGEKPDPTFKFQLNSTKILFIDFTGMKQEMA